MFNCIKYIKKIGILFILSLLYTTAGIGQSQNENSSNILIINSYNKDVKWAVEVVDTVKRHILNYSQKSKITIENLNFNETPNTTSLEASVLKIINTTQIPNIVVLIGNEADTIYTSRISKTIGWEKVKSIWVNVGTITKTLSDNGTGIGFGIPIKDNVNLIKTMIPNINEILFIDKKHFSTVQSKMLLEKEIAIINTSKKIKLNTIFLTKDNIDSVYNIILENKPKRAILTCTWNFIDKNSFYTKTEIDSLFSAQVTSPIFSIFPNFYNNNFIIGGYNLTAKVCAEKIIERIKKIMLGTSPNDIAYEEVKNGDIILNKMALTKFTLDSYAKNYFEVQYVNIPVSQIDKYKYELIICIFILVLLVIFITYYIKRRKENRHNMFTLNEIKSRFATLQKIYNSASLNYAIYGNSGEKLLELINDNDNNGTSIITDFLPLNLFNAEFITKEDIGHIKGKKSISKEYNSTILKKYSQLKPQEGRIIHLIIKAIQAKDNESYKYIAIASDITSTKADRIEKEILDNLIKDATKITNIGVASYNILTGEGFATENWYNNLGENNDSKLIQPTYFSFPIDDKAKIVDFKQNLVNATATRLGLDIKIHYNSSGKDKWIRENIFLHNYDPKNGIIEVIDINFDINKEKVKEINFINLNTKAENANNDSDKFISSISHEIRTPLTSIMGFSNMLTTLTNNNDRAEIINIIKRNNVMLIELVNNILSISKIDSGTYTFETTKVELNEFFHELKIAAAHMVTTESEITNKKIEIICDIPNDEHIIITDEWNFRQVMINLLSNAVKFTQEGTILFGYQLQDEGIYFYVKDTGCGIAPENQERIFNRFEKLDDHYGTGLGLSLCKSIVNHLNGEIGVISQKGEGSTFWFILKNDTPH
ncbi:MAG: HAMP domain-containing sensor histidine kinase [Bacteroidales bacterium]